MDLNEKIQAIKQDTKKTFPVSPCELVNHFGYRRRSWYIVEEINASLNQNGLELDGDLYHAWFYGNLTLRHKTVATTKVSTNPIKRVNSLEAANHKPVYVDRNCSLTHAITLMQQFDFSQLPVVSGNERNLCGYISWKSIGLALWQKKEGDTVNDYMVRDVSTVSLNTPLLDVIKIISVNKFVVVLNEDKTLSGIITSSDIAKEFFTITQAEAFLLLEQIELQIRMLIGRAKILLEDIKKVCKEDEGKEITCIDDLTFGGYCQIIQHPEYWAKLDIQYDHSDFIKFLENIRVIRNAVMHFEPDGIGEDNMKTLRNMARYLSEIIGALPEKVTK